MLHELLLSLSGHPSALFDTTGNFQELKPDSFPLLSPPEAELLTSIGRLSQLHRQIRNHAFWVSSSHPSTVCRSVATAITSYYLEKFQRKILDVESRILKKDSTTVGAYNIVPLAGLVSEFAEWNGLMEWLWTITTFLHPTNTTNNDLSRENGDIASTSGAVLIDKLRVEAQTGYPDIEEAAFHLGKVAETAWLRQLSTWLLYGRLPSFGTDDFFVHQSAEETGDTLFAINHRLLPKFVSQQTASSIMFIGKSLNQIRTLESKFKTSAVRSSRVSEVELLPTHLRLLSEVTAPISSAKLSESVGTIRLSLSRNLLQHLLPLEKILEILHFLQEFFLLGRGEFAVALITEADEALRSRHRHPNQSKPSQNLRGVLLKEGEIAATLAKTWSILSTISGEEDHADDALDLATDIMHLVIHTSSTNRPGTPGRAKETITSLPKMANVAFNDLLLSIPTVLTMDIRSPLDLFISNSDLEIYSNINAYLLAVRRAHLHLADLWRHTTIRRVHPPPPGPQFSSTPSGKALLARRRRKADTRGREMRKVWATCSAATFFLSESGAYFEGEVVQASWKHFREWVTGPDKMSSTATRPQSSSSNASSRIFKTNTDESDQIPHDPETLASAHRQYLRSLTYSLLLTDFTFTKTLREFLTHVDELVAFIVRLQHVQQNLDLEEDGIEDPMTNYKQEEKDVSRELDRARRRVDSDLKTLVSRLRDIDAERVESGWPSGLSTFGTHEYESWRVGGVDRLLMKLDWGTSADDDHEQEDWD